MPRTNPLRGRETGPTKEDEMSRKFTREEFSEYVEKEGLSLDITDEENGDYDGRLHGIGYWYNVGAVDDEIEIGNPHVLVEDEYFAVDGDGQGYVAISESGSDHAYDSEMPLQVYVKAQREWAAIRPRTS